MESRHGNTASKLRKSGQVRSGGGLPADFTEMVREVFTTNFDREMKKLAAVKADPVFSSKGEIFPNEIVLSVTLGHEGQIAATTVYASVDFDPKASSPTAEDLLGACIDALGAVFSQILADESLSALENVPYEWTKLEIEKHHIFVKIDKSNPALDEMADDWLAKNDPKSLEEDEEEQKETEKLFVTGPKRGGEDDDDSGGHTVH